MMFCNWLACAAATLAVAGADTSPPGSQPDESNAPVAVVSQPGRPRITIAFSPHHLPATTAPASARLLHSAEGSLTSGAPSPVTGPRTTRLPSLRVHQRLPSRAGAATQRGASVPIPATATPTRQRVVASAVPDQPPGERPRVVAGGWAPQEPFTVHADIQSYVHELRGSIPVHLGNAPIQRDVYLITDGYGLYPKAGPHMIAMDPSYTRRHLAKLRHDIDWHVPKDTPVLCVLDWESWWPVWERNEDEPSSAGHDAADLDFKSDWRDYIRQHRPRLIEGLTPEEQERVFKQTFEAEAQKFFLATLAECKRIRPQATWGVYALPFRSYWDYRDEEKAATLREHNDDLAWLWPVVDFIAPSIYCFYKSCESGCENTPAEDRAYIEANLAEALRVADGKPVYAYIWGKYHSSNPTYGSQFLNEVNLTNRFQIPFEMGLDGVILFELIRTDAEAREFETYFNQSIVPEIDRVLTAPR